MSKGVKRLTPKRFWYKLDKRAMPWFAKYFYFRNKPHVMSKNHNKHKWFFRHKKWFTDEELKRMSMKFPTSHDIWGWD